MRTQTAFSDLQRTTVAFSVLSCTLFLALPSFAVAPVISTVAGTGISGYSGDGGAATFAEMSGPAGVFVNAAGDIFIAEEWNHIIRKVDTSTGIITTIAGTGTAGFSGDGGPAATAQLNRPSGIAADGSGNIYISCQDDNRIRMINASTGIITTIAGNGSAGFSGDGGPAASAQLNGPGGIFADASGNVFIADYYNNRIRKIDAATGNISTVAGNGIFGFSGDGGAATSARLKFPVGVFADASGNLFIADQWNQRIRKVTAATGIISTIAGTGVAGYSGDGGAAAGAQLNYPSGILTDASGYVFISDASNHRIRQIDPATGIIATIAGSGTGGYAGDGGAAISAQLSSPYGIAIDAACNLFIAESGNNVIRQVMGVCALPVELLSFTAKLTPGGQVLCSWITAAEINNDHFVVERSFDLQTWEYTGTVKGAGTSSLPHIYTLTDTKLPPHAGEIFYRLKQVDFNGNHEYFGPEPVRLKGIEIITIFPNPSSGNMAFSVASSVEGTVSLRITDMLGQYVVRRTENISSGENTFSVNISSSAAGTYVLHLETNTGNYRAQKQFAVK